jgi:hypothetical protein
LLQGCELTLLERISWSSRLKGQRRFRHLPVREERAVLPG